MLKVKQTRYDYPYAAKPHATHGWVLIRTDSSFGGKFHKIPKQGGYMRGEFIGVMTEPYDTAEHAVFHLKGHEDLATVAYAEIER